MLIKYGEIGCIDAQIDCEPRFTNQLGVVDLVYKIEENEPYMLGELEIQGNDANQRQGHPPRGRDGRAAAGRGTGQEPDRDLPRRLTGLGYFMNNPKQGKQIKIEIVRPAVQGQALRRPDDAVTCRK